jgi:hypothetical protein
LKAELTLSSFQRLLEKRMFARNAAVALTLITIGLVFTLWLKSRNETPAIPLSSASMSTAVDDSNEHTNTALPLLTQSLPSQRAKTETTLEEPLAEQYDDVAIQFAEAIQYPSESLPIFDPTTVQKYIPNQSAPIRFEENDVLLSLRSDHLRFSPSQAITGSVSVKGEANAELRLTLIQAGQIIADIIATPSEHEQPFQFPPLGQRWQNDELQLVATLTSSANEWVVSTPILREYFDADSAQLTSIEPSRVDGAWLIIPVNLRVESPGFYRIEANLYAASDNRPLLHLTTEGELTGGSGQLLLRAHIRALKAMQDEGDYLLKHIALEQMPSPPDFETTQGLVSLPSITIQGHPFNDYTDEPFLDAEALARLEFLQSMSKQ